MDRVKDPRFESRQVTDDEWLIVDHRYGPNDLRGTVACVYRVEDGVVDVVWLRDLPLAGCYQTVFDVLEDIRRFYVHEEHKHLHAV